jgi:SLT domain-containing protein
MRGKISLLAGGAIGYVLGTRAGRERYEQIVAQAQNFWNNPKVQEKASQAQDLAKEKAPIIKDKVSSDSTSTSTTSTGNLSTGNLSTGNLSTGTTSTGGTSAGQHRVGGVGEVGDDLGGEVQGTAPYPTSSTTGLG